MTLYISQDMGDNLPVVMDLVTIVLGDESLTWDTDPNDGSLIVITYDNPSNNGIGAQTVYALANPILNLWPNDVVITPVDVCWAILPDGTEISAAQGETVRPSAVCSGQPYLTNQTDVIAVYYDTSDCCGSQYHTFDANGAEILSAPYVALFHELRHALHYKLHDIDCADVEGQVIRDENVLRTELDLYLRDPANHKGDCGAPGEDGGDTPDGGVPVTPGGDPPETPGVGPGGESSGLCLIATAATGSRVAPDVQELRRFRDEVLLRSVIGRAFFADFHRAYYRFSPGIAMAIRHRPALAGTITHAIVRPLVAFLRLAEGHLRGARTDKSSWSGGGERHAVARSYVEQVFEVDPDVDAEAILDELTAIGQVMTQGAIYEHAPQTGCDEGPIRVLQYFARVVSQSPRRDLLAWALLNPLISFWGTVVKFRRDHGSKAIEETEFADQVEAWIASAPLGDVVEDIGPSALVTDLRALGRDLFADGGARSALSAALLRGGNEDSRARVRTALATAGYPLGELRDGSRSWRT